MIADREDCQKCQTSPRAPSFPRFFAKIQGWDFDALSFTDCSARSVLPLPLPPIRHSLANPKKNGVTLKFW
jgi:hypothetical protein